MKTKLNIFFFAALSFLLYASGAMAQCSSTSAPSYTKYDNNEWYSLINASATGGGVSTINYSYTGGGAYGPDVTYINESGQGVTAAPGATVTVNITKTTGTYPDYMSLFVDWNHNGTFESNELVGSYTFSGYNGAVVPVSFVVPASAVKGTNLPLRVFNSESGTAPCSGTYGQTIDFYINVCSAPVVIVTSSAALICSGSTDTIAATGAATYSWQPAAGLSGLTGDTVIATPDTTTTYTVVGTVIGGCSDTVTQTITVVTTPVITITPSATTLCSGDTLSLNVTDTTGSTLTYMYSGTGLSDTTTSSSILAQRLMDTVASTYMYTVVATTTVGGCSDTASSAAITVNPTPLVFNLSGTGSYCAGGTGIMVNLDSSSTGINYQLYAADTAVGNLVGGAAAPISFGTYTAAGNYIAMATNSITGCRSLMNDTATITINPLPNIYAVTGGGSYCAGGTGVAISIDSSDTSVVYSMYSSSALVGTPVSGTGFPVSFAPLTVAGTYKVGAMNTVTGCIDSMTGTATITIDPLQIPVVSIAASAGLVLTPQQADTFTATVTNGGSAPVYQWYINGIAIHGATSLTFSKDSLVGDTISFSAMNTDMCGSSDTASVVITKNLAVNQLAAPGISAQLVPNPNNGTFTVAGSLGNAQTAIVTLEVTDMLGRSVYKTEVTAPNGTINAPMHLSTLPSGTYLCHIHSGNDNAVFHFVVR